MDINSVVISSGHGLYVRGASGILDEVDEARRVVERVAQALRYSGIDTVTYHDDVSTTQNENLNRIVDFHNSKVRDLDVSVHFNAYEQVEKPMGTETLYVTQSALAAQMSAMIATVGFIDRGPKKRTDLFFLNNTEMPAILIEVCFVDSEADADLYIAQFDLICETIAAAISGNDELPEPSPEDALFHAIGPCSYFGGPEDDGVDADEGLAFFSSIEDAPHLFLAVPPEDATGLARRLNPFVHYIACRWDYNITSKSQLASMDMARVTATRTGKSLLAFPADWGPHEDTGRIADLSPSLMLGLGIETDDEVEVTYPWRVPP